MNLPAYRYANARVIAAGLILVAVHAPAFTAELDSPAFFECRRLERDASRLACYDSIGSPPAPTVDAIEPQGAPPSTAEAVDLPASVPPAATISAAATTAPTTEYVPLDDDVGQETLSRANGEDKGEPTVRGRVVSCQKDASGKYLFYFDNGQVWRQKDNARLRWNDCAFDVMFTKDMFGYKMNQAGEKKKIRIARVK